MTVRAEVLWEGCTVGTDGVHTSVKLLRLPWGGYLIEGRVTRGGRLARLEATHVQGLEEDGRVQGEDLLRRLSEAGEARVHVCPGREG